ncbi:MAG: EAL domain-containing protein [Magnetococcales bacterium]|nr:EAL domain-containing protein [Magnetococcales bacterium]
MTDREESTPGRDCTILEDILATPVRPGETWHECEFGPFNLRSAFQPIFSLSHRRPAGFEGLIRATGRADGRRVSPKELFGHCTSDASLVSLDRRCQLLHILNFHAFAPKEGWLFVNMNPRMVLEDQGSGASSITSLLNRLNLPSHRLVIEILEKEIDDETRLMEAISHYRNEGCLIALDDFGAGQSNFDRIWRLQPEIVKLDRAIIVNSVHNPKARRMLPSLVSLIHEAGCLALIEGIETREEAMIAIDSETDLVQGFYFATPECELDALEGAGSKRVDFLTREFRESVTLDGVRQMRDLSWFLEAFVDDVAGSCDDTSLLAGCARFVRMEGVMRCFILDGLGHQLGANLGCSASPEGEREKYHIMAGSDGADWSRRQYFRRAMARPGEIQVTGSYLSLPDARMCVTLSQSLRWRDGTVRVVCADLAWNGPANIASGSIGGCTPGFARKGRKLSPGTAHCPTAALKGEGCRPDLS